MRAAIAAACALLLAAGPVGSEIKPDDAPAAVSGAYAAPATSASKPIFPPDPGPPPIVAASPVDAQATEAAKKLYKRLRAQYGKRMFSGHTDHHFDGLKTLAGKTPVVKAWDMQYYSPANPYGNGSKEFLAWDDGSVKAAIDWHANTKGKGIVTLQWHWYSPSDGKLGKNTFEIKDKEGKINTSFDVSKAVVPGTAEHAATLRDIDAIAVQLKKLQDKGVPVLWRPLHEAAGGTGGAWFWWGAKGPEPLLKLYDLMFDRMTNHHKLHNLIWVWSEPNPAWYPGNGKVDIVGYDSYPPAKDYSTQKKKFREFHKLVGGQKMIALTENGAIPDPDKCLDGEAPWLYFLTWADHYKNANSAEHIKEVYAHPLVVTLEAK